MECQNRSGNYRVTFKWSARKDGANLDISNTTGHKDSPIFSTLKPYTGPLCEHELAFLRGKPGFDFSPEWEFKVVKRK